MRFKLSCAMHRALYLSVALVICNIFFCDAVSPLVAVLNRRNSTALNGGCAWDRFPYKRGNSTLCGECHVADVGWFSAPSSKTQYCARSEPYSTQLLCRTVTALAPQCPLARYCDQTALTCAPTALAPRCDQAPCPAPLVCDTRSSQCVTCAHHVGDSAHRCVDGAARPATITWSELSALPRHLLSLLIAGLAACCLLALAINFRELA